MKSVNGPVSILGGGPAGASAAIAALQQGRAAGLIERSKFPRHKVCGEFFSPEIGPELDRLGAWDDFMNAEPARIERVKLHFGRRERAVRLPERAWGLSRYAFDGLLLERARRLGAAVRCEPQGETPAVIAAGRNFEAAAPPKGRRVFGFKAHYQGPADDAVELFFFDGCYVGINAIEGGRTNVCGLGPEDFLARHDFDYDRVIAGSRALTSRLAPLTRGMKWLSTGPLRYGQALEPSGDRYLAGDALSFVDPFTGSGLAAAVKTGALAGAAAARGEPVAVYLARCRETLKRPFRIASLLRSLLETGWADSLAALVPARLLFAWTRPSP